MAAGSKEATSLREENERLKEEKEILREIIIKITRENVALREDNQDLTAQNSAYLEQISRLQTAKRRDEKDASTNGSESSQQPNGETTSTDEPQFQQTIDQLQQRLLILVQEKLGMHSLIESLEHELKLKSNGASTTGETPRQTKEHEHSKNPDTTSTRSKDMDNQRLLEKIAQPLNERRREKRGGIFSTNRSRSSSRTSEDSNENLDQSVKMEFDIRQELEEKLHKRGTVARPIMESTGVSYRPNEECYDRASWDRIKNNDDVSGMFDSEDQEVSQSQFVQTAIERRRSSGWVGRFNILGSDTNSNKRDLSSNGMTEGRTLEGILPSLRNTPNISDGLLPVDDFSGRRDLDDSMDRMSNSSNCESTLPERSKDGRTKRISKKKEGKGAGTTMELLI